MMYPEKRIELVHFQITKKCNLRCRFCGQWGEHGFFSSASGTEMTLDEWKKTAISIAEYGEKVNALPSIMLWGGEPLMSPYFREITEYLSSLNFELGIVTNGVLIDRYAELLKQKFKKIYISVDGPRDIHDSVRGNGVFDRVKSNIQAIKNGNAEIVIMTVLTYQLLKRIDELPKAFDGLSSQVILHDLIYMTDDEIGKYCAWYKNCFDSDARDIYSWKTDIQSDYHSLKRNAVERLKKIKTDVSFLYSEHGENAHESFCLSPFRHIHVAWNGNVMYCTDHYDFSAGNVRNDDIISIFENDLSEKFRREVYNGRCLTCRHCSWKNNKSFYI